MQSLQGLGRVGGLEKPLGAVADAFVNFWMFTCWT